MMLVGTGSDVGKSVIATAFCRIFRQDGYRPAPFKAQNMALNSFATPEGLEIGRAQAVQAEAAGIPCHTDMNPLLLKPQSDHTSQVVLNGRPIGNRSAYEYFRREGREELRKEVCDAYDRLAARFNPIVLEGAGSISELNLRERDITNMRMAIYAGADTYLVADIDRGGVFGSVYGTIALLTPEERARMKGIIINKFRGDITLFDEGKRMLEELTGLPVVGIVPYFRDIYIEEEDSVVLNRKRRTRQEGKINVAIVLLPRMSNFTDFDVLEHDARFNPYYTNRPEEIEKADIIVLPGSKNTLADLQTIWVNGAADAVVRAHHAGKKVIGICGGYQMMGIRIDDPEHTEGNLSSIAGLGLLPQTTVLHTEKITRQNRFTFLPKQTASRTAFPDKGYEIHTGDTQTLPDAQESPVAQLDDGRKDGYLLHASCWGTYLHGILDNPDVLDYLAEGLVASQAEKPFDYAAYKEEQYDRLAAWVRAHVDFDYIYRTATEGD